MCRVMVPPSVTPGPYGRRGTRGLHKSFNRSRAPGTRTPGHSSPSPARRDTVGLLPRHAFFPRTSALCHSFARKEWAGYLAVCNYDRHSEREYFAFRHTAGLIDVTPLASTTSRGLTPPPSPTCGRATSPNSSPAACTTAPCATKTATRWTTAPSPTWNGTFRATTSEAWLGWYRRHSRGFDVTIADVTGKIGASRSRTPRPGHPPDHHRRGPRRTAVLRHHRLQDRRRPEYISTPVHRGPRLRALGQSRRRHDYLGRPHRRGEALRHAARGPRRDGRHPHRSRLRASGRGLCQREGLPHRVPEEHSWGRRSRLDRKARSCGLDRP